jgi:flagellar biosynthesis chaperone FliJ
MPMKTAYETQLVQLEELIVQQRKQVQTLTNALDQTEQRYLLVNDEQSIE